MKESYCDDLRQEMLGDYQDHILHPEKYFLTDLVQIYDFLRKNCKSKKVQFGVSENKEVKTAWEIIENNLHMPEYFNSDIHNDIIMQEIVKLSDGRPSTRNPRFEISINKQQEERMPGTGVTVIGCSHYRHIRTHLRHIRPDMWFQGENSIDTLLRLVSYADGGHRIYARTPAKSSDNLAVLRVASDGRKVTLIEVALAPFMLRHRYELVANEEVARTVFNTDPSNKEILVDYLAERLPYLSDDILGAVG